MGKDGYTICKSTEAMLERAKNEGIDTAFFRADKMKPCPIGSSGACCKNCSMGPCRLNPKDPKGTGICGANYDTIAARNFARMVAAGASAHSDHGREIAELFLAVAKGEIKGYEIKDEFKLKLVAESIGIQTEGRTKEEIAIELGETLLADFGRQHGEISFVKRAPKKRQELWREKGIVPRGIDREIVEIMHRTHMGVDQEYHNILLQASRCALGDGWGGSMIATELSDIMFGTPYAVEGAVDFGCLDENKVNIIVHGHEPQVIDMISRVVKDPEMINKAKEKGAEGINLLGMCCTGNEMLMRYGIPVAGNMLQSDVVIITGAVEAMAVDVQCIMAGIAQVAKCFHTLFFTTNPRAHIEGAQHIEFEPERAEECAKEIVLRAIENFSNRNKDRVDIPKVSYELIAGFSHEMVDYMLGGRFRASYWPLNDNIIGGRIRGVAGVVGCVNPRVMHDWVHVECVKELIKNDVLVLQTGCSAIALAKVGLLTPEAAKQYAGDGLAEVCEAVGIPPVLHVGSCVDNSRILIAASEMVKVGGLGDDISKLPTAGAAPEWMSEKAISIGHYFVSSGVFTVFGVGFPIIPGTNIHKYLMEEFEQFTGGMWAYEPDPYKMAKLMIAHIDRKRKELGIDKARERILFDMAMRRELEDKEAVTV